MMSLVVSILIATSSFDDSLPESASLKPGQAAPAWSGLLTDLAERGLLQDTLVVWMGEVGRTPYINNRAGRDHFIRAWTIVLAGGGVKGGVVYGATDEVGYQAVENRHYYSDLHATILHQLGLDYKKMEHHVFGRTFRLVEEGGGPIKEILA